jgi:hypothetical protein
MRCLREWSSCNVITLPQFLKRALCESARRSVRKRNNFTALALSCFGWRLNVAQAAWKRRGSPIGKKGTRKPHPAYKRKFGQPWSTEDLKQLRALARENTPTGVLSVKLQRPETAIRSKASREGISLRPTNRSPYNRRKRSR